MMMHLRHSAFSQRGLLSPVDPSLNLRSLEGGLCLLLTEMSSVWVAVWSLCFLRGNKSSFMRRDSPTNRNTASNARRRGRARQVGVKSKPTSLVRSAEAIQLSHSSRRKANLYCAGCVSQTDPKLPILWLRDERQTSRRCSLQCSFQERCAGTLRNGTSHLRPTASGHCLGLGRRASASCDPWGNP
jgi:hypothetical protein